MKNRIIFNQHNKTTIKNRLINNCLLSNITKPSKRNFELKSLYMPLC